MPRSSSRKPGKAAAADSTSKCRSSRSVPDAPVSTLRTRSTNRRSKVNEKKKATKPEEPVVSPRRIQTGSKGKKKSQSPAKTATDPRKVEEAPKEKKKPANKKAKVASTKVNEKKATKKKETKKRAPRGKKRNEENPTEGEEKVEGINEESLEKGVKRKREDEDEEAETTPKKRSKIEDKVGEDEGTSAVDGVELGKIEETKEKLETEKMEVDGADDVNNIPEKNSKKNDTGEKEISDVGTGEMNGDDGAEVGTGSGEVRAEVGTGSGEDRAEVGTGSGEDRAEVGTGSGEVRAEVGTGSGEDKGEVRTLMETSVVDASKTSDDRNEEISDENGVVTNSAPVNDVANATEISVSATSSGSKVDGGMSHSNGSESSGDLTSRTGDILFSRKFQEMAASDAISGQSFSLVSYNILADYHAQRDYVPPGGSWVSAEHLSIEYRHKRLMQELVWLDSDIICLQEVGTEYFSDTLQPALKELGFDGLYVPRHTTAYGEGEATFFKTSRFFLESSQSLILGEVAIKGIEESELLDADIKPYIKSSVDSHAVSLLTRLKSLNGNYVVTVANIHVAYDKFKRQDKQCLQIATAVRELINMAGGADQPQIICGDFNSWPGSPPYQLMQDGHLNEDSLTTLQAVYSVQQPDGQLAPLVNFWPEGFHFPPSSNFSSSYKTVLGVDPLSSRFNCDGVVRAVDYIWFSSNSLDVLGVLPTVDGKAIQNGVPNAIFPSDHLSIKATFSIK